MWGWEDDVDETPTAKRLPRNTYITTAVTSPEAECIHRLAAAAGVTTSTLVRQATILFVNEESKLRRWPRYQADAEEAVKWERR